MTTFKSCNKEEFKESVSTYLNSRLQGCECKWMEDSLTLILTRLNSSWEIVNVPFEDYEIKDTTMKDIINAILYNIVDELNYILEEATDIEDYFKDINELSQIGMELKNWKKSLEITEPNERR